MTAHKDAAEVPSASGTETSRPARITSEEVADLLAQCLASRPNYPSPDDDQVSWLTSVINRNIDKPWTIEKVAMLRKQAMRERAESKTLQAAAAILLEDWKALQRQIKVLSSGDLTRNAFEHKAAELKSVITLLYQPRGYLDHPGLTVRLSNKGPPPEPWALTAAAIAHDTIRTLANCSGRQAGIGSRDGPVVNFVRKCLALIMPGQDPPSHETVYKALKNHLSTSLKHQ